MILIDIADHLSNMYKIFTLLIHIFDNIMYECLLISKSPEHMHIKFN